MKMLSKILLIVLLLLGLSLPLASGRAYAMAQITMVNRSQLTLNLYIDGNFGCGPVLGLGRFTNSPGLFCTSSVTPGPHRLEARDGEKVMMHEDNVNIGDGTSPTWTVTIANPDEELIQRLNGARYFYRSGNAFVQSEIMLEIRGTVLIWNLRYVWARPDIAQSMADGTNGFIKGPVGTWVRSIEMQIVGRKARLQYKDNDHVFTVSEDGTSIVDTNQIEGGSITFFRQ